MELATIIYGPPLRRNRASLSRVADTASSSPLRQESFRFCPRVFGHFRHFSQKSALKRAQIRAPDWTYVAREGLHWTRELTCKHTSALEQRDYPQWPPAPQEQSFALHSRFRPRVLAQKGHFPQESALKGAKFRAPDWTYVGPGEGNIDAHILPWSLRLSKASPRSAG